MLRKLWVQKSSALTWKPQVEEHQYDDGTLHYRFRDRLGKTHTITQIEADKIVETWGMEDITEQMIEAGWIHPKYSMKNIINQI